VSKKLETQLPESWESAQLCEIATLIRGISYKKEHIQNSPQNNFVPLLRATNITGSSLTFEELVYVPERYVSEVQLLSDGDIVIAASSGSKEIVGKAGQFTRLDWKGTFGAFCTAIRPDIELNSRFIGYYFQTPDYREAISEGSAGSNINNIKSTDLATHLIPVAPKQEQTRIVEKLEELLSDLDAGVAELKAAQKKLMQYRQSLLKAAVEGTLTAEWRKTQQPEETGAQLLARILKQRRANWEAKQLAKFQQQGKTPPKGWQDKYPEPVEPDTRDLPELPEGWVWASIDQLSPDDLANGRSVPTSVNGAKVLRLTAVTHCRIDQLEYKHGKWTEDEAKPFAISEGDLLIVRGNGSLSLVGRAGLVGPVTEQIAYPDTMIRLRILTEIVSPKWIGLLWDSQIVRSHLEQRARTSAGIYKISQPDITSVIVPIPPLVEQDQLINLIDHQIEDLTLIQKSLDVAFKQSAAQRKNILKNAFSGQLVPQDPNDEPASVLLERIQAERLMLTVSKNSLGGKRKG